MKKLLMYVLVATLPCVAETESFKDNVLDVLGQFGQAAAEPVILVKDAAVNSANAIAQSKFAGHVNDVATQVAGSVKDAYAVTASAIKKASQKVQDVTNTAVDTVVVAAEIVADKTKEAAEQTAATLKNVGAEIRDTAHEMGQMIKENAKAVANSEVGQNTQDVVEQFVAFPGQVVDDVKDLGKTIKRKASAAFEAARAA